jgi:hypothetical protein
MSQPSIEVNPPRTPRWVKVSIVITIVLVVLVGALLLTGGHGPSRHSPSNNDDNGHKPAIQHEMPFQ